ncbi:MAG: hypothetical protein NT042_03520 [Sulfuritalea sp.]|nr:hypothetical protein [Sulfuritalea sp.]
MVRTMFVFFAADCWRHINLSFQHWLIQGLLGDGDRPRELQTVAGTAARFHSCQNRRYWIIGQTT